MYLLWVQHEWRRCAGSLAAVLLLAFSSVAAAQAPNRPPIADAGGVYQIDEGQALDLNGSGSSDPDAGDTLTFAWDLDNDGQYDDASGETPTVSWAALEALGLASDGSWLPVGLRVDDGNSGVDTDVSWLAIDNLAPTATHGGPYAIDEGADLALNGTAADAGNDALTAGWDLDGDGTNDVTDASNMVSWAALDGLGLADDGTALRIVLSAEDADGASTSVTATLTINNLAPVADAGGPYTAALSNDLTLTGSATDAGGDTLAYAWDIDGDGQYDDASGAAPAIAWADLEAAGLSTTNRITIGLEVIDGDGGTNAASAWVQLANDAPVADVGGPYGIDEGNGVMLDASGSSDANLDPLTFAWDLDNDGAYDDAAGESPTVSWAALAALGLASDGSSLTIGVQVRDDFGGTNTAATTLAIANVAPVADAGGPYSVGYGSNVTLSASSTDAGGDTVAYAWDLDGDGEYDDAAGTTPLVPWFMIRGLGTGTHTIGLQATDADGAVDAATAQLSITGSAPAAGYVSGDFHQHTTYTDGRFSFDEVMEKNAQFGLDWWANSEHGGGYARDGRTASSPDYTYWDTNAAVTILGNNLGIGYDGHTNMWRWQSLRDYSFQSVLAARATYADRMIIQGFEWNVPGAAPADAGSSGHEHCTMGCIANQFGASPNANPVAQFEYQFDRSDNDTSGDNGMGWSKSPIANDDDAKMVQAAQWLAVNYGTKSWLAPAHPERKKCWNVDTFRTLNNAAPTVAFGFESMPGHQKASDRGGYGASADGGGTYGGCGIYAAQVGGLWDALLGEGRAWWLFASSDFHNTSGDFWPGEYQKTYTYVSDRTDAQAIVDGLRSGDSWVVLGDLIDALEFDVNGARMGSTLTAAPASVTVTIRVRDPEGQNWGPEGHNMPVLDHIDVIAGEYTGLISPSDPAYTNDTNPTAEVIARFDATGGVTDSVGLVSMAWTDEGDGWKSMSMTVDVAGKKKYLRLRGTNKGIGEAGETDGAGNPLLDVPGQNTAEKTWDDLWFYSNPIFVAPTAVELVVSSAHGAPTPSGTNNYSAGAMITATVDAIDTQGLNRYVCTGWTGTGSVPTNGANNSVGFAIATNSTLAWNWQTQHMLDTEVNSSGGSVDVADSWQDEGAVVTITATPAAGYAFTGWSGDVASTNNPLVLTMSQAYSVTAMMTPTVTYVDDDYSAADAGGHAYGDNAFSSIQQAVDAVQDGGTVYVEDGVFDAGSTDVNGMATRLALTRPVTVRSVNGAYGAVIAGAADPAATNGPAAVRCAYVGNGASLIGFTLSDGHTQARPAGGYYSWWIPLIYGGGVFAEAGGLVADCIVEGCSAAGAGGGAYLHGADTTLRNSLVIDNAAAGGGGGVCVVSGGTVESCTISDNVSTYKAGGLWASGSALLNCIVWGNAAPVNADLYRSSGSQTACWTADPSFINPAEGNYGLAGDSACIDAGADQGWMSGAQDLYGEDRVQDGDGDGVAAADIGAGEFGAAPRPVIVANGWNAPLSVAAGEQVLVQITVNNGQDTAEKDWWILAATGGGWYYFDLAAGWRPGFVPTYQGPFMTLGMTPVMDTTGLPAGNYWFYFAVDGIADGLLQLDSLIFDAVEVNVQ